MKINNKILKISVFIFMFLSAVLAVFRGSMYASGAIDRLGLYTDSSVGGLFNAFAAAIAVLTAVCAFFISKKGKLTLSSEKSNAVRVSAVICCAVSAVLAVSAGIEVIGGTFDIVRPDGSVSRVQTVLLALETVLYIAAAVYFAGMSLKKEMFGMLALCPASAYGIRAVRVFTDTSSQINASQRSFMLAFMAVTMLFFVACAEFHVPLGSLEKKADAVTKRCAKFFALGLISAELAVIFSVTGTVFTAIPNGGKLDIVYGVFDLMNAVFAFSKILSVGCTAGDSVTGSVRT